MENPGLNLVQAPALTATLHGPYERCVKKIVQLAPKLRSRLCPQKVP